MSISSEGLRGSAWKGMLATLVVFIDLEEQMMGRGRRPDAGLGRLCAMWALYEASRVLYSDCATGEMALT